MVNPTEVSSQTFLRHNNLRGIPCTECYTGGPSLYACQMDKGPVLEVLIVMSNISSKKKSLPPYLNRGRRSVAAPRYIEHRLLHRKRFLQRQLVPLRAEEQDRRTGKVGRGDHLPGGNPRPVGDGA